MAALLGPWLAAVDYVWPGHGTISFEAPAEWSLVGKQAADVGYSFNATPRFNEAAVLQITLADVPKDRPAPGADLKDQLQKMVQPYLDGSVENKFQPMPLALHQGEGWFVELTDASLVGKPPVPGDYKVMRNALLTLDERALVVVTMQFDQRTGKAADGMLAILASMRFDRTVHPGQLTQSRGIGFVFTVPESRVTLHIPSDRGLTQDTDRIGGSTNNPRYFKVSRTEPNLIISGWFEPANRFKELKTFWTDEAKAMEKSGQPAPGNVTFLKIGAWDIISYDFVIAQTRSAHLRAELVQDGTWIDLHLSATSSIQPIAALREQLLAALKTVQVTGK